MSQSALRGIVGLAFLLGILILEIRGLARVDNYNYRHSNSTGTVNNQWRPPGALATTRNPNQAQWNNQWNNNNNNNTNNWHRNSYANGQIGGSSNNTNNWHRNSAGHQYPGQQPQANSWGNTPQGQQASNPWMRNNQSHPQLGWNMRLNASYAVTTPRAPAFGPNTNWKVPQQYPGGVRPQNNSVGYWGPRLNNTTPLPGNNGNNFGWGSNNTNWKPQQQTPNNTIGNWNSNPTFGGGLSGGNSNSFSPYQTTPPPRVQQPGGNQPWTSGAGNQWNNTNNQWNSGSNNQWDGAKTQPSGNAGGIPLSPIGGSNPWNSGGSIPNSPIGSNNNPWNSGNNQQTGSGSVPLAPIGGGSLWNSGNNQFGSGSASGVPLAPLGGGGPGLANGGQASLSYGYGQPQGKPSDSKAHPYANLFHL